MNELILKSNSIQFATVREDPRIELTLIKAHRLRAPVMVGSGGCTAFAIASAHPTIPIDLIEPNAAQIELIRTKAKRLTRGAPRARAKEFGVGRPEDSRARSLIEVGNFESLFRQLLEFLHEFVIDRDALEALLISGDPRRWRAVFAHAYWPVAFDLFFSDSLLRTMFGSAAIQHAPRESYAAYFRTVFEKGLLRRDRATNYFIHHLMLGHYLKDQRAWPPYLSQPPRTVNLQFHQCLAQEYPSYASHDLIGLSNIFDWSSEANVRAITRRLRTELAPGALVVYRQLNNAKNFRPAFGSDFSWLDQVAARLHRADRSLFYSSLHLARRI